MYKKFTLEQLLNLKHGFLDNLRSTMTRKRYPTLKQFLKHSCNEGECVYFFQRSTPTWRIIKHDAAHYTLIDEREKIQLEADGPILQKLHQLTKTEKAISKQQKNTRTMRQILWDDFRAGERFGSINGKPYLVYDIETPLAGKNLEDLEFYIAYAYIVHGEAKGEYRFVGPDSLQKFVDFMLSFDGYIVGYNNLWFDNPVSVYNSSDWNNDMIKTINDKSIDIFIFLWNLTGKRMGLNKVADALVGISKTLESGAEGAELMKLYQETGDESHYKRFKRYCKNDVEMTVLVLFYILKHESIFLDDLSYTYSIEDVLYMSSNKSPRGIKQSKVEKHADSIFNTSS